MLVNVTKVTAAITNKDRFEKKVLLTFTLHIPVKELLEKLMLKYEEFKGAFSFRLHTDTCDYE